MPNEEVETLDELRARVTLDGIRYRLISAQARDVPLDGEPAPPKVQVSIRHASHNSGDGRQLLTIGLNVAIQTPSGQVEVDPRADYVIEAGPAGEVAESLAVQFANEVAIADLMPYARQAIADISSRVLNETVLMPMFQPGLITARYGHGVSS